MNNSKDIHCSDTTCTAACDDIVSKLHAYLEKVFYMANNIEAIF